MSRKDILQGAAYGAVLLWINAYVCRTWLFHPTAYMNSLHGSWAAVARLADGWLRPSWWPFWDLGIPLEHTSAPLVPALTAALAAAAKIPHLMAVQAVSAIFYCAAPVALFLMSWMLTRAPGYSFFAGLFYSLMSPAQLLAPDGEFSWAGVLDAHRFMLQAAGDATARSASFTFVLLFIVFFLRSVARRGRWYTAAAAISLGLAILASPFAILSALLSAVGLLTVFKPDRRQREVVYAGGLFLFALALTARYLPPSLWASIIASSTGQPVTAESIARLATTWSGSILGWLILAHLFERWSIDWTLRFFALLAYAMSYGPILARWADRRALPQPQDFRIEMESAIALLLVFALRRWVNRLPRPSKTVLACLLVGLAIPQIIHHRRLAKAALFPARVTDTADYRISQRMASEYPAGRVLLPGSIAHWANAFTAITQFSGSDGTMAYNQVQQDALNVIYAGASSPDNARVSLAWLRAYGAAAVAVNSGNEELLPELWSEAGVTVYRIPQRSDSLAHVIPESYLVTGPPVRMPDTAPLDRYNAALDDPSLPEASFEWQGHNHIRIQALLAVGQVVSIQVSYHPGWRVSINGRRTSVNRDRLGMMWVRPPEPGFATLDLDYDGGWEVRICGWLSLAMLAAAGFWILRGAVR